MTLIHKGVYLGFDFGLRRIGVAVGQCYSCSASPLVTLAAKNGTPDWVLIERLLKEWKPQGFVVGIPTAVNGENLTVTDQAKTFAAELEIQFKRPVYLVDERYSTIEARSQLFAKGGYRNIKRSQIDSIAACIILEQWLGEHFNNTLN